MKQENLTTQLKRIEEILTFQNAEPINFVEACKHLSISKSYLYKLTCKNQIPYYKPNGKKIYFEKAELNKWLLKNRIKPDSELKQMASDYSSKVDYTEIGGIRK